MRFVIFFLLFIFSVLTTLHGQTTHSIKGVVINKLNRKPLDYINVQLVGSTQGDVTDSLGHFIIDDIKPGIYKLKASAIGYKSVITPEYIVSTKNLNVAIEMEESVSELEGVTITASTFRRNVESPTGLRIIGLQEIEKSPGANRDISKIVQLYPGVAFSPASYRNDLIVRGGGPSENSFYLDGIEIPNINHFSTQGASGGPVGLINADFIREVGFYSGSFPANRGNSLSSVIDLKLRDGDMERRSLKATLGASEVSLSSNGYLGEKTSYLVSVRQSYLQFLFDMLNLPFLPTFTDAQFKIKTRFNANNELTILGLGGIDNMRLNTKLTGDNAEYILSYLPKIQQETFTVGALYRHFTGIHVQTFVVSHNYLNNRNTKYKGNDEATEDNLMFKINSIEQETKFRFENTSTINNYRINVGANLEVAQFSNNSKQKIFDGVAQDINYNTAVNILQWGMFGTVDYTSNNDKFTASLGLRFDANNFSSNMNRLSKQVSPRVSASYAFNKAISLNAGFGIYHQMPQYTAIGFKNNLGEYMNKSLKYMSVTQSCLGLNWRLTNNIELSAEGFYKQYSKIPLSVIDGIPLACKGDDYGIIGNELLLSQAQGRAYGVEILARWIIANKLNVSSSLTFFKSEYRNDKSSPYIDSAWDNRYIFNLSGTYNLPKNWSVGMKISSIGGVPYTPYDIEKSALVDAWDAQGKPYYDYSLYNTERLPAFTQLDVRVDKVFYIKKYMLGFYIDLQNALKCTYKRPDILISTGEIENPTAPQQEQRYKMRYIDQRSGTILPTIGITFEY